MTDLEKIRSILRNQKPARSPSDWPRVKFTEGTDEITGGGAIELRISNYRIAFIFDRNGRFVAPFNYKE